MIDTELRGAATLRVPAPDEGHALIVTRYDEEKAVVMNPRDFRRLAALDAALAAFHAADAPALTPLALEAHRFERRILRGGAFISSPRSSVGHDARARRDS